MSKLKKTSYGDRKNHPHAGRIHRRGRLRTLGSRPASVPRSFAPVDTPLLVLLILSVCAIWRDALRSEKQNENTNE